MVDPEKVEVDDRTLDRWTFNKMSAPCVGTLPQEEEEEEDEEFHEAFEKPGLETNNYIDGILR